MAVGRKEKEVRRFVPCGLRKEWENRSERAREKERERKSESERASEQERKSESESESEREGGREDVFSKHENKERQEKKKNIFLYLLCISSRLKFMKSYFLVFLFLFESVFALLGFYVWLCKICVENVFFRRRIQNCRDKLELKYSHSCSRLIVYIDIWIGFLAVFRKA